jgi:hypothetical protein
MLTLTGFCRGGRPWLLRLGIERPCPLSKGCWLDGFLGIGPGNVGVALAEGLSDVGGEGNQSG